jgi:hypothetical protein
MAVKAHRVVMVLPSTNRFALHRIANQIVREDAECSNCVRNILAGAEQGSTATIAEIATPETKMAPFKKTSVTYQAPATSSVPDIAGLVLAGDVRSKEVISNRRFPLGLWRHELRADGRIRINRPAEDHLFWVVSGSFTTGVTELAPEGVISIAKNAVAELSGHGEVMHFIGQAETRPEKPGGCVHVLPKGWMERSAASHHTLYLDSSCSCCSVWLHRTHTEAGKTTPLHHHTEAEVIGIIEGSMIVGPRRIATGGAIGVGQNVIYSFTAGEQGLTFINFRQADPFFVARQDEEQAPASERILMRELLERLRSDRVRMDD